MSSRVLVRKQQDEISTMQISKKRNKNRSRTQATSVRLRDDGLLDQFYTKSTIIDDIIVPILKKYMHTDSIFVDFSCGQNTLGYRLKTYAREIIAYDIAPTVQALQSGAIVMDWFNVTSIPCDSFVGLNPPFGYRGNIAQDFINHTLKIGNPMCLFLILPIRNQKWDIPGYIEVEKIKLPLDAFICPNDDIFSFPCYYYVFKRSMNTTIDSSISSIVLPQGFNTHTHVKHVDMQRCSLLVRRVGYYAGRQFYFVINAIVSYYHKGKLSVGVDWDANKHNIDNSFWVIYLPPNKILNINELCSIADRMIFYMDDNAETTRKDDVKRALSINSSYLHSMILHCLHEDDNDDDGNITNQ